MKLHTESSEADDLANNTANGPYRPGLFWRSWMLSLCLISMRFFLTIASAQTGLPLNFSPLSNPLPNPQSYYVDCDPNIPLGDKTPLILIHGIDLSSGPPTISANGWDNFCIWFYNTPSLTNRLKIYRFAYQSNQSSVQTLGGYLAQLLNANDGSATDQQLAGKDIVVLAHSMGGLVARRFMEEQRQSKSAKWNQSTLRLVALATPHHGTPAANRCDPPAYVGALGYKLAYELGTPTFASAAATMSTLGGIFGNMPSYNQANRLDLLWDNYDGLFTSGLSPEEINPPAATLNAISSAQSYDNKIIAYAGNIANGSIIHIGHDGILSTTADILANGLGIPSDGIVPIDSAWFQGRVGNSQLRFFDDYDHYQMMKSKTPPGDLPSLSDPLFTVIGKDITNALPALTLLTISSVSPRTLNTLPLPQTQLITITGTGFTSNSRLTFNDGVTSYPNKVPASWTATQLTYNIAVGPNPATWTVKVVNGASESLLYSFYVVSGTAELTSLGVNGPYAIAENSSGQFTATAYFSDGSQQNVTSSANWSENSSATTISSSGLLSAVSVSSDTAVTISASYTTGGITKSANANTTIVNSGSCGSYMTNLIVNGDFESGSSSWTVSGGGVITNFANFYHSPTHYLWLGGANNEKDAAFQTITIPGNATAATLSFYYNINSAEGNTTAFDTFSVKVRSSGGTVLATLANFSNINQGTPGNYAQSASFNLLPYAGTTIQVYFTSTNDVSNVTNFRVDDVNVAASIPNPVVAVLFGIGGPTNVAEGGTAQFNAVVVNCDGSIQSVTPTWSENSSATTISSSGLLTAGSVSSDTLVTVTATYGSSLPVNRSITVVNSAASFSYLAISGPSSINENSSGQFTASAIFSDGSSQSVTPSWSENSSATTISSGGLLSASEVGSDTTVTVSASHTIGGITRNANQDVLIVNIPPPVTLSSLSISGPNSVNENSTAQYAATASFSDGSSQSVNPTWSENSAATSISIFGLLSAGEVASDMGMTVSASYTYNAITRNASTNVTVKDIVQPTAILVGLSGNQIVLTWPTNSAGFWLEYTTNLPPTGWLSNSALPVIVDGRYTVTNPVTGGRMFYRLRK